MARITTKEYVAARQMKKNGDCIAGDKPGGTVFFCVMALVQKTDNYWTSTYTFFENRLLSSEKNHQQRVVTPWGSDLHQVYLFSLLKFFFV